MARPTRIAPCLWFDGEAEAAAQYYTRSSTTRGSPTWLATARSATRSTAGPRQRDGGRVRADGVPFTGLNGGPMFPFTEAMSLQVHCDTQAEIDHYWGKLGAAATLRRSNAVG